MILELALLSVIKFPAGSPHDFVKALGPATARQCVVLFSYAPDNNYKEFSADPTQTSHFSWIVNSVAKLRQAPGLDFAFSDGLISRNLISLAPIVERANPRYSIESEFFKVKDGIVSTDDRASTKSMQDIFNHEWKSEVDWHWTMRSYTLSVACKDIPEAEFLKYLAKAAGMRLDKTKAGFAFKLVPSEFRRRANATIAKYAPAEKVGKLNQQDKWRLEMTQFALSIASDLHIQKAFETEDSEAAIFMEGSTKQFLGSKLLKMAQSASSLVRNGGDSRSLTSLKPVNENGAGGLEFRGSPAAIAGFTEAVDWRRPVTMYLRSNFRVRIIGSTLPRDPNYSGPTAPVSVDF